MKTLADFQTKHGYPKTMSNRNSLVLNTCTLCFLTVALYAASVPTFGLLEMSICFAALVSLFTAVLWVLYT